MNMIRRIVQAFHKGRQEGLEEQRFYSAFDRFLGVDAWSMCTNEINSKDD